MTLGFGSLGHFVLDDYDKFFTTFGMSPKAFFFFFCVCGLYVFFCACAVVWVMLLLVVNIDIWWYN